MMGQPNRGGTPRAERSKPNWAALRRAMGYNRHYGKIMLIAYGTLVIATLAQLAVPTPEHFVPMLCALGLRCGDEQLTWFNDQPVAGSLTMTSFVVGA